MDDGKAGEMAGVEFSLLVTEIVLIATKIRVADGR
jgi:hypothetical protein